MSPVPRLCAMLCRCTCMPLDNDRLVVHPVECASRVCYSLLRCRGIGNGECRISDTNFCYKDHVSSYGDIRDQPLGEFLLQHLGLVHSPRPSLYNFLSFLYLSLPPSKCFCSAMLSLGMNSSPMPSHCECIQPTSLSWRSRNSIYCIQEGN